MNLMKHGSGAFVSGPAAEEDAPLTSEPDAGGGCRAAPAFHENPPESREYHWRCPTPGIGSRLSMAIPERLQKIIERFASAPRELRGQALLRYAKQVPPLPPELANAPERMQRVHECQSPFFLTAKVDGDGAVHLFFDCPPETPTVRGFAGILMEGLEGEHYSAVLEVPTTFYSSMGLGDVVSPLRLRGMGAILAAIKNRVREEVARGPGEDPT
jgi:cysteine desulfuration protein SufE